MSTSTLTIEVKGNKNLVTSECAWRSGRSAPDFTVTLPAGDALTIALDSGTFGQVKVEGDLEIDPNASRGSTRAFRWSSAAAEKEQGDCEITLVHARTGFNDVVVSVSLESDAGIEADEDAAVQSSAGFDAVHRYGAYIVGFLGALCALIAATFMPASASTLIAIAGTIAVVTFFFSGQYRRFGLRLLCMLAAGVALIFAYFMPEHANALLSGAATIAILSLIFA